METSSENVNTLNWIDSYPLPLFLVWFCFIEKCLLFVKFWIKSYLGFAFTWSVLWRCCIIFCYTNTRGASLYSPVDFMMVDFFLLLCSEPEGGGDFLTAYHCLSLLSVAPQMGFKNRSHSSSPTLFPPNHKFSVTVGKQWGEITGHLGLLGCL